MQIHSSSPTQKQSLFSFTLEIGLDWIGLDLITKMETWVFTTIFSLCVAAFLKSLYDFMFPKLNLPQGLTKVPSLGNLLWLLISSELEPILRNLHPEYGPIVTFQIGSGLAIFVSANSLAHQALVRNGAILADRPEAMLTNIILRGDQQNISSAVYGPTWRLLCPTHRRDPPSFTREKLLSCTKVSLGHSNLSAARLLRIR